MSDEEFQKAVMGRFIALDATFTARFDRVDARLDALDARFDRVDRRMDAIAARMDDVENRIEEVAGRLSLLQSTVNQVVGGTTRALDAIATLSTRVTKLENPDD